MMALALDRKRSGLSPILSSAMCVPDTHGQKIPTFADVRADLNVLDGRSHTNIHAACVVLRGANDQILNELPS
jgi:hypothetical protein